jgi:iron only hydrogenase large subunit-like protein
MEKVPVIYTIKAQCRDCYRCLRNCPVKAIEMKDGQAYVVDDLCIKCGTCIRECPQNAKTYRNDVEYVKSLFVNNQNVCATLAPAFAAMFDGDDLFRFISALRALGFSYVGETSVGAEMVAQATKEYISDCDSHKHIATACPAVVSYFEKYYPKHLGLLTPIVSPMVAHSKYLKDKFPNCKVVFIGPCLAKKAEAERDGIREFVDAVLSFDEVFAWLEQEGIDIQQLEKSALDEVGPNFASLFPLEGGLLKTAELDTDIISKTHVAVSGSDELTLLTDALDEGDDSVEIKFIEPLYCKNGCINGPLFTNKDSIYKRRSNLNHYVEEKENISVPEVPLKDLTINYNKEEKLKETFTDDEIKKVLEQIGKFSSEDEFNCTACGYDTCRDKAIAVLNGMAEIDMCIPYMRRLAEQRTDKIIETNPNGVVIIDRKLNILHTNPAFCSMFKCSSSIIDKNISYLIDPEPFEKIIVNKIPKLEETVNFPQYGLECRQIIYPLPDEQQYVGIFVNITDVKADHKKLKEIRSNAVKQAQELLEHQIHMAQHLAQFLGESTARGELLVENIMNIVQDEPEMSEQSAPNPIKNSTLRNKLTTLYKK